MRALIVDDEPLGRRGLRALCRRCHTIEVVGDVGDGREAVKWLRSAAIDLVFLDIQMQGMTGFEIIREVGVARMPLIIFVTAHHQYALPAFDVQAVDYLTKPIREDRFLRAVARAGQLLDQTASPNANFLEVPLHRIVVQSGHRSVSLDPAEVDWVLAENSYATVYAGGRQFVVVEPLKSIAQRLAPAPFVRVHRSALVNVARIREVQVDVRPARVLLTDGTRIPLSRRQRSTVLAAVRRFGRPDRALCEF